jgi:nucleoside 2-deoxyribosyltransferase
MYSDLTLMPGRRLQERYAGATASKHCCRSITSRPRPKEFSKAISLIRKAQIVIANLNPFRGLEPDSGTAFELGYAFALDKQIYGYVTRLDTLAKRVGIAGHGSLPIASGRLADSDGMLIENFDLPCNLMLAVPANIVEGGLEECLQALRAR